jgi:flagellar hook assembly protein FlgD
LPGKRYDYVLTLQTRGEVVAVSPIATATMPTIEASVGQNHPNPFNPATTIDVTIPERSELVVAIYDARGARVATLNAGIQDAGTHRVEWNGTDDAGRGVGSGVYFYRLEGAGAVASKKMVLLK